MSLFHIVPFYAGVLRAALKNREDTRKIDLRWKQMASAKMERKQLETEKKRSCSVLCMKKSENDASDVGSAG